RTGPAALCGAEQVSLRIGCRRCVGIVAVAGPAEIVEVDESRCGTGGLRSQYGKQCHKTERSKECAHGDPPREARDCRRISSSCQGMVEAECAEFIFFSAAPREFFCARRRVRTGWPGQARPW